MSDTIEVIDIVDQPDDSAIMNMEDCQSGRSELPAKELNRKVPRVRIPHLPPI